MLIKSILFSLATRLAAICPSLALTQAHIGQDLHGYISLDKEINSSSKANNFIVNKEF